MRFQAFVHFFVFSGVYKCHVTKKRKKIHLMLGCGTHTHTQVGIAARIQCMLSDLMAECES